jgi:hypothetical protein
LEMDVRQAEELDVSKTAGLASARPDSQIISEGQNSTAGTDEYD